MKDKNGILISCKTCKHLERNGGMSCLAFPNGIPVPIMENDVPHDKVVENQTGKTVWEPTDNQVLKAQINKQFGIDR